MPLKGIIKVEVRIEHQRRNLVLCVVDMENVASIFGYDWFKEFGFEIRCHFKDFSVERCFHIERPSKDDLEKGLKNATRDFTDIFSEGLGHCNTFKADIKLKSNAIPKFVRPHNIPFALHENVRCEIDRLVSNDVLESINFSEWASPIVIVKKVNGSILKLKVPRRNS